MSRPYFMEYRGGEREPAYDPKSLKVGDQVIIGSGGGRLVEQLNAQVVTVGRVWVHIKPYLGRTRRFRLADQREDQQTGYATRFYTPAQHDYHRARSSATSYLSSLGVRLDWDSQVNVLGLAWCLYGIHGDTGGVK